MVIYACRQFVWPLVYLERGEVVDVQQHFGSKRVRSAAGGPHDVVQMCVLAASRVNALTDRGVMVVCLSLTVVNTKLLGHATMRVTRFVASTSCVASCPRA